MPTACLSYREYGMIPCLKKLKKKEKKTSVICFKNTNPQIYSSVIIEALAIIFFVKSFISFQPEYWQSLLLHSVQISA